MALASPGLELDSRQESGYTRPEEVGHKKSKLTGSCVIAYRSRSQPDAQLDSRKHQF